MSIRMTAFSIVSMFVIRYVSNRLNMPELKFCND